MYKPAFWALCPRRCSVPALCVSPGLQKLEQGKQGPSLDAAQPQSLNKTKGTHCFTGNQRQTNEVVLPSIREAACMAVRGG